MNVHIIHYTTKSSYVIPRKMIYTVRSYLIFNTYTKHVETKNYLKNRQFKVAIGKKIQA